MNTENFDFTAYKEAAATVQLQTDIAARYTKNYDDCLIKFQQENGFCTNYSSKNLRQNTISFKPGINYGLDPYVEHAIARHLDSKGYKMDDGVLDNPFNAETFATFQEAIDLLCKDPKIVMAQKFRTAVEELEQKYEREANSTYGNPPCPPLFSCSHASYVNINYDKNEVMLNISHYQRPFIDFLVKHLGNQGLSVQSAQHISSFFVTIKEALNPETLIHLKTAFRLAESTQGIITKPATGRGRY